jgi:23S rRNA pseudouridine2605 synthase
VLADAGLASRRQAERWIEEGRVSVDGLVVCELGARADPEREIVALDGRRVPWGRPRKTYVLHKPRGVVTTTRDPHARKTVLDLVRSPDRLFPVGRLDAGSEGLLLLTNDGALAQILTHPSFEVPRTYRVSVDGEVRRETVARLRAGVSVDGRRATPHDLKVARRASDRTVIEITLLEGRRRQIRKMMEAVGHPVRRLVRTRFGPVRLGGLASGKWRGISAAESRALNRLVDQAARTY